MEKQGRKGTGGDEKGGKGMIETLTAAEATERLRAVMIPHLRCGSSERPTR